MRDTAAPMSLWSHVTTATRHHDPPIGLQVQPPHCIRFRGFAGSATNSPTMTDSSRSNDGHRTVAMKPFTALFMPPPGPTPPTNWPRFLPLTGNPRAGGRARPLGLLVARRDAAWLMVSLPAGAWIDRAPRRTLLLVGLAWASPPGRCRDRGCCQSPYPTRRGGLCRAD